MKRIYFLIVTAISLSLTSCIEVIDDLALNEDGSGTFKYSLNLSASKIKINSILALETFNDKPVPSKAEIEQRILDFKSKFINKPGISNVSVEYDLTNYRVKFQCDFNSLEQLQKAVKSTVEDMTEKTNDEIKPNWLIWNDNTLIRSVPEFSTEKTNEVKPEDRDLLKQGSYTSITRFYAPVVEISNPKAQLNPSKTAVMLRTDTYSLMMQPQILDNRITVSEP